MIIGKIAKAVIKLIMPEILEHLMKVFKMDKLVNYMELENEADRGILKLQDEVNILKGTIKGLIKDSEDVKDVVKKLKNKKIFKSL